MSIHQLNESFENELKKVLELVCFPIQAVLASLRLYRENAVIAISDEDCRVSETGGSCTELDGPVARKLALYASTVCGAEKDSLLAEFPHLVNALKDRNNLLCKKRKNSQIEGGLTQHNVVTDAKVSSENKHQSLQSHISNNSARDHACTPCFKRYNESSVWTAQQTFYESRGAGVWERGEVPSLISSNSFVANMYVQMIIQMAEQHWLHQQNRNNAKAQTNSLVTEDGYSGNSNSVRKLRVAVVEIGAGHGLLSFLMAREFQQQLKRNTKIQGSTSNSSPAVDGTKSNMKELSSTCLKIDGINKTDNNPTISSRFDVTVIGTDFHSSIFQDLLLLPWIRDLCEEGLLDFAVCGSADSNELRPGSVERIGLDLLHSGRCSDDKEWDMLVIVGNYAFDSFPSDLVACTSDGDIYEIGVGTVHTPMEVEKRRSGSDGTKEKESRGSKKALRRKMREPYMARQVRRARTYTLNPSISPTVAAMVETGFFASPSILSSSSVHSVPVVGLQIMEHLKIAFPVSIRARQSTEGLESNLATIPLPSSHPKVGIENNGDIAVRENGTGAVIMLVGDCIVGEDDIQWQSKEFNKLLLHQPESSIDNTCVPIPWFDPPLISPQPSVCAVPITPRALDFVFKRVFDVPHSRNDSCDLESCTETGSNSDTGLSASCLRTSTPLCGSSFSVLTYTSAAHLHPSSRLLDQNHQTKRCDPIYPRFGPHDLCTIRELILCPYPPPRGSRPQLHANAEQWDDNSFLGMQWVPARIADTLSLAFLWDFIVTVACVDSHLFVELRWVILRKIVTLGHAVRKHDLIGRSDYISEVKRWSDAALQCVRQHSCLTLKGIFILRSQVTQWLVALGTSVVRLYRKRRIMNPLDAGTSQSTAVIVVRDAAMYVLQSCLALFSKTELQAAFGKNIDLQPTKDKVIPSYHISRGCSFYHMTAVANSIWRNLLSRDNQCLSHTATGAIGVPQHGLIDITVDLHLLSLEEAVHCAMAIRAIKKVYSEQSDTVDGDSIPQADAILYHLDLILEDILRAIELQAKASSINVGHDGNGKIKMLMKQQKLYRRAKGLLQQLVQRNT